MSTILSNDEAELYDRQIRLWGVNAQNRIRQSKVLMLGFNGVASEVAKILVLAGIDSLTIVDDLEIQHSDITSNLFCRPRTSQDENEKQFRTHAVSSKLKTMNPLVKVSIDNSSITSREVDSFSDYDLVTLHSFLPIDEIIKINDICRKFKTKFYVVLDFGYFAFMFNDLGKEFKFTHEVFKQKSRSSHDVPIDLEGVPVNETEDQNSNDSAHSNHSLSRPKKRLRVKSPPKDLQDDTPDDSTPEKETIVDTLSYVTFREMISLKANVFDKSTSPVLILSIAMIKFHSHHNHLPTNGDELEIFDQMVNTLLEELNISDKIMLKLNPDFKSCIFGSLSPVCAIVGGVAGQDMIRALSGRDIPICNTFVFDGLAMNGVVEKVGIEISTEKQAIVRDVLEISDDED